MLQYFIKTIKSNIKKDCKQKGLQALLIRAVLNFLLAFFLITNGLASENINGNKIVLNDYTGKYPIGIYVKYLEDKQGTFNFDSILNKDIDTNFSQSKNEVLNFGFSNSVYWLTFDLLFETKEKIQREWLLEIAYPHLDRIELYIIDKKSKKTDFRVSGDTFPFHNRELDHRNFVFQIRLKPGQEVRCYIKVKTESSFQLPMTIWSHSKFSELTIRLEYCLGLFIGTIFIMFIYNIFLFLTIKDKNLLYYIAFMLVYLLFQMILDGHAYQFFWSNSTQFANTILPISMFMSGINFLLFGKSFLELKKFSITANRISCSFIILGIIFTVLTFILNYSIIIKFASIYTLIWIIFLSSSAIFVYIKGNKSARFYIAAWFSVFIGLICYVLKTFGLLPTNVVTEYSNQFGSMILITLLSIAVVDRININRKEYENAQKKAFETQKKLLKIQEESVKKQIKTAKKLELDSEKLSQVSDTLADNVVVVTNEAESVAETSEDITISIRSIAGSIEEMSVTVENISSSAKELSLNIDSVAHSMDNMSSSMAEVEENALKGSSVVDQGKELSNKTTETMKSLGYAATEIGKVTNVIKKISDKTNLLALNAAIEAAAAGEAGKGFAVVANSIQKFADQSSEAAEEITNKITDVQIKIEEAIKVTNDFSMVIENINIASKKISNSITQQTRATNNIATNVSQANSRSNDISSSIYELAKGVNDMSKNATEIAEGSNHVATNIRHVSKALVNSKDSIMQIKNSANELTDLSKELCSNVS